MRQPDFAIAAMRALAPAAPTRASAPVNPAVNGTFAADQSSGADASFGSLMRDVQGEVSDFIEHGGGDGVNQQAPALSVEGSAVRAMAGADSAGVDDAQRQQFLAEIAPWTRQAAERLGVAPHLVAAHAALESGWGQRPLRQRDGSDSNNLFAIKAGSRWQGAQLSAATTEYAHGVAMPATERFRSYAGQGAAFHDYAQLLLENPRYHAALNTGSDAHAFAQGLAKGGYATDPAYADKLTRLAARLAPAAAQATPSSQGAH